MILVCKRNKKKKKYPWKRAGTAPLLCVAMVGGGGRERCEHWGGTQRGQSKRPLTNDCERNGDRERRTGGRSYEGVYKTSSNRESGMNI